MKCMGERERETERTRRCDKEGVGGAEENKEN